MKKMEIRATSNNIHALNDDEMIIEGYAVVFDSESQLMFDDGKGKPFKETVSRDAFDGVSMDKVFALYNHDYNNILARSDADNLDLKVDDKGLWFRAKLPNTTLARDVYENVKVGNVSACSFGFTVAADEWEKGTDGIYKRTINKIKNIIEITLTPYPAYEATTAEATRSYMNLKDEEQRSSELNDIKKDLLIMKLDAMKS